MSDITAMTNPMGTMTHGPSVETTVPSKSARTALLEAARRLAGEQNGKPFGVREVARAAGVNHSLVYRYYGSLEGLLEEATRDRDAMTLRLLDDPGTDAVITAIFDVALEQPFIASRLAELSVEGGPHNWTHQALLVRRIRERVADLHPDMTSEQIDSRTASLVSSALGYVLYESFMCSTMQWGEDAKSEHRLSHRRLLADLLVAH